MNTKIYKFRLCQGKKKIHVLILRFGKKLFHRVMEKFIPVQPVDQTLKPLPKYILWEEEDGGVKFYLKRIFHPLHITVQKL